MSDEQKKAAARFVAAARSCVGTAFHHQGRRKAVGLDCIGVVVVALQELGFQVRDQLDYSQRPDGKSLVAALEAHGARLVDQIQAGDVLLFRYDHQPQHVAVASSVQSLIHAFAPAGQVVETHIGPYWTHRLIGIYRFNFKMKETV